jgi:hypothetical protein
MCQYLSAIFNNMLSLNFFVLLKLYLIGRHELFPNKTIPNVIFPNWDWRNNPENGNLVPFPLTKLGEGRKCEWVSGLLPSYPDLT